MNELTYLPSEILQYILESLPAKDILACTETCRKLNDVVKLSAKIQLILELAIDGYRLCSDWRARAGGRPPHELQKSFRKSKIAMNNCEYTSKRLILTNDKEGFDGWRFPGRCRLIDGIFAHLHYDERVLRFYKIHRSQVGSGDISPWLEYEMTDRFATFAWDTTQDLLVLAVNRVSGAHRPISLRTLSNNEPHPLAVHSTLQMPADYLSAVPWPIIVGEVLILRFQSNPSHYYGGLVTLNWRTGEIMMCIPDYVYKISMLTQELIIALVDKPYYTRHRQSDAGEMCGQYALVVDLEGRRRLILCIRFSEQVMVYRLEGADTRLSQDESYLGYYTHDPKGDRMLLLSIGFEYERLFVFISTHRILELLPKAGEDMKTLQWEDWGPLSTRCLTGHAYNEKFYLSGTSFYGRFDADIIKQNRGPPSNPVSQVFALHFDFNQRRIQYNQSRRQLRASNGDEESSTLREDGQVYAEEHAIWLLGVSPTLRSHLPFRWFMIDNSFTSGRNIMFGVDHIVTDSNGNVEVLYFDN